MTRTLHRLIICLYGVGSSQVEDRIEIPGSIEIIEYIHSPLCSEIKNILKPLERSALDQYFLQRAVFYAHSTIGPDSVC